MDRNQLAALLIFAAAAFGTLSLVLVLEMVRGWLREREVKKRLEPTLGRAGEGGAPLRLLKEDQDAGLFGNVGLFADIQALIEQARLSWSVPTFVMLTFGLAMGVGFAVLLISGSILVAGLMGVVGASIPYLLARRKRTMRERRFEEHFPEAIDLLTRAIRAGHPLSSGIKMVADEASAPVNEEFQETFEQQRFGMPFDEALIGLADRVDLVDVRIFATAVLVQREVGGNLAEILDNLADTIRARFAIRRQLRVYTAQGRLSGYVLGALPIFVGTAIFFLDRDYMMVLFTEPIGRVAVVGAVIMQIFGYLWIRKIVNIEI